MLLRSSTLHIASTSCRASTCARPLQPARSRQSIKLGSTRQNEADVEICSVSRSDEPPHASTTQSAPGTTDPHHRERWVPAHAASGSSSQLTGAAYAVAAGLALLAGPALGERVILASEPKRCVIGKTVGVMMSVRSKMLQHGHVWAWPHDTMHITMSLHTISYMLPVHFTAGMPGLVGFVL